MTKQAFGEREHVPFATMLQRFAKTPGRNADFALKHPAGTLLPEENSGRCRKDRKIAQGRLWGYLARERNWVCFEFTEHWRHEPPMELFKNSRGFLQPDGCKGYDKAAAKNSGIVHVGCWAHDLTSAIQGVDYSRRTNIWHRSGAMRMETLRSLEEWTGRLDSNRI